MAENDPQPPANLSPPNNPPQPPVEPAEPPAARTVIDGKTEAEIALENKLAAESVERRKAETKAAELEDKLTQLTRLQTQPPAPAPKRKRVPNTFFDPPDEEEA